MCCTFYFSSSTAERRYCCMDVCAAATGQVITGLLNPDCKDKPYLHVLKVRFVLHYHICTFCPVFNIKCVVPYLPSPCQHSDTSESGSTGSGCVSSCPQDSSYWPNTHTSRFSARCAGERINRHTDNQPPNTINHLIFDLFNSIYVFSSPSKSESRSTQVRF